MTTPPTKIFNEHFTMINECNSDRKFNGYVSIIGEVEECKDTVVIIRLAKGKRIKVEKVDGTYNKGDILEVLASAKDEVYSYLSATALSKDFDVAVYDNMLSIMNKYAKEMI